MARSTNVLCLTGTPVLNRIDELYHVVVRIAPDAVKRYTKESFIRTFAARVWQTPWGMKHDGIKNEKALKKLLETVMLSRQHIEGLPDRTDKHIPIELKGSALKKFIAEEEKFLREHGITADDITNSQKLSQADMTAISAIRQQAALHKIPLLLSALEDIQDKHGSIIIYCYHHAVLDALAKTLPNAFAVITGKTPMKERMEIIRQFQAGEIPCILATIGALREGVNLTAGSAILFLEFDWTPAMMEQCIARIWRKGQDKNIAVYYFYFRGGIDAYIMRTLKNKRDVIKKIMEK
jgi:SNF2 family DNA or RNA helicase